MLQLSSEPILPRHPLWEEFTTRLTSKEGCDVHDDHWTCYGDLRAARAILGRMGLAESAIEVSLAYFKNHGGYCDCEVLMNVARSM
jgi:hypothetical protein